MKILSSINPHEGPRKMLFTLVFSQNKLICLSLNLVIVAWLISESSLLKVFPTGTTVSRFDTLTLCSHTVVATTLLKRHVVLMSNRQVVIIGASGIEPSPLTRS